ncbi:putative FKBP-type 16 kDa peptidyl-prolyl cis-trans isomerase [Halomicronema hongdechloris C2206]|uniref:Peptidyl-prolyl cis-trans isomerase n=1 Tax=Halomicronema hongdechloris C2206 TaxID=1641165 RepID=A0A1Z3HNR6_9CYAN|nr:putative FKBP-type 16 kDa peptidyl-prolyl cis-trans isomerase [Halomicronema hongdechloris C2206]
MAQAQKGDTVLIHYTGKLTDGTVFDSSVERGPLQFDIGAGNVIPGFETAVIGMSPGDSKTETIGSDQAYGPHRDEMVVVVDRQQIPDEIPLNIGQQLQLQGPEGRPPLPVLVTEVSDGKVTLDANHPLAGEDLVFDIELVDIVS